MCDKIQDAIFLSLYFSLQAVYNLLILFKSEKTKLKRTNLFP